MNGEQYRKVLDHKFRAVPNSAISGQMGLERCGHDFEPAKTAVSKLGLGLKRENRPFKTNFTAEPHLAYDCSALALTS